MFTCRRFSAVLPDDALNSAALAGGVHETDPGIFGRVRVHGDGQIVSGDRLADRGEPFFPLPWAVWLPIGVQKSVPAQRTAAALGLEQTQGGVAQRGWVLPTPVGPVGGQGWVVRGRRAWHQLVPYDFRPGEFRQVGAACAVTEYPVSYTHLRAHETDSY